MKKISILIPLVASLGSLLGQNPLVEMPDYNVAAKVAEYKTVKLKTDISALSQTEKDVLYFLIKAAEGVNDIFWKQTFGPEYNQLLENSTGDLKRFIEINYGPWDRLNNDAVFVQDWPQKNKGAAYYPAPLDQTKFDQLPEEMKNHQYSVVVDMGENYDVRRYSEHFQMELDAVCKNLEQAFLRINETDRDYAQYLMERVNALRQDEYDMSDRMWLDQKTNKLDIIIGPIESYDDKLMGARTAFESYVLVRDLEWSKKLEKYLGQLPDLQKNLPVAAKYKKETPGSSGSQLAVFDAVYYAGDCNSGSKTIAVNLPNSEELQNSVGTRRTQIKNVMKAKFDEIVTPISRVLINPEQQKKVNFNAFFNNVMFHEVAHGLGIKNTIDGSNTVKNALGTLHNTIEECKADVLGLWMVTQLVEKKELEGDLEDYYVTFVSSVFRSVRFGAGSAHGKANLIAFNKLLGDTAIVFINGTVKVNVPKMKNSITKLAGELLTLQGNGNATEVETFIKEYTKIGSQLSNALVKISGANVPVDIVFEQGVDVLGLQKPGAFSPKPPKGNNTIPK